MYLFSGVLGQTQADPFAELQRASADQSPAERREGAFPHLQGLRCVCTLCSDCCFCCVFQYDSDGSDSQESNEEAELRRKKIVALKVSLQEA